MSTPGPPGGPYPGQPQDPWHDNQSEELSGQSWATSQPPPSGYPPPVSGPPTTPYGPSGYGPPAPQPGAAQQPPWITPQQPGYPGPGGEPWGPPTPPPRRKSGAGLLIAALIVLGLLVCAGAGTGIWLYTRKNPATTAAPNPSAGNGATSTRTPTAKADSTPTAAASSTGSVTDSDGGEARTAKVGECLVNKGTDADPDLRKATCTTGSFQILKRFEGTAETSKCKDVPAYTHHYFFKSSVETYSFVLCMKVR